MIVLFSSNSPTSLIRAKDDEAPTLKAVGSLVALCRKSTTVSIGNAFHYKLLKNRYKYSTVEHVPLYSLFARPARRLVGGEERHAKCRRRCSLLTEVQLTGFCMFYFLYHWFFLSYLVGGWFAVFC